jgi:hypothetical protein
MKRALLMISAFLAVVASPMVNAQTAQPLTDQYIASIRVGCADALQGILQVQRTEAATRVNRGREYEALLRLVAAFNSRVVLNKIDAPVLTATTSRMQQRFAQFQQHYLDYADKMDATLDINCKEAPVTFYDNLTAAREARAQVANDVVEMNKLLDEYQQGLNELKTELKGLEGGQS